jgi:peptidyl-prolyl cis-trans isomerase C
VIRGKSLATAALATLIALAVPAVPSAAAPDDARRSRPVITVGSRVVTVGEVEDRIAELPPFEAERLTGRAPDTERYAASHDEIVRAFAEQVIVRDLLLVAGAEEKKLADSFPTRGQVLRAKSTATLRALRSPASSPSAIPADDVRRYYDENRSRFEGPERVNLWRILCKSREEALSVLADAKRDLTISHFQALARDHSIDKATNFRGGNLGFLDPEGASNEAGLKVEPPLVKAASGVRDGELVPDPVPETGGFAVVWRRTTVPATHRSLEEVSAQIRTTIFRQRTEAAEKQLIDELRKKNLKNYDPEPLKIVEFPFPDAGLSLPRSIPSPTPRSSRD